MRIALIAVVLAALAGTAVAGAASVTVTGLLSGDPRVCTTNTPGGSSHHAYWCAQYAAKATVGAKLAGLNGKSRWFQPVLCSEAAGLLKWRCGLINAKPYTTAVVTFSKTSSGWQRTVRLS